MKPHPFYTPGNLVSSANSLRYSWTGWPSRSSFPAQPAPEILDRLDTKWESDGFTRLETLWKQESISIIFSVKPQVSPVFFTARVKGRLQHELRCRFKRNLGFRSIGDNNRTKIERYISNQVEKEQFVDERFAKRMKKYTLINPGVRLDLPTKTNSGRYWYNLHLVLVVGGRARIVSDGILSGICGYTERIAEKHGYGISARSMMPDHLHLALRGNVVQSPEEIALCFMNNLSYAVARKPIWQPGYYAGTFSEYDMGAIRAKKKLAE